MIGRGHSERLVPMIDEMLEGRTADRILVGVGPGSFTGIRVGIAAAHGLAIGWGADLGGMSSLALLAASAERDGRSRSRGDAAATASCSCSSSTARRRSHRDCSTCRPARPPRRPIAELVVGTGARRLVGRAAGAKRAKPGRPPRMRSTCREQLRSLPPRPIYARAPDARPRQAA